ncbi:hypothetical protein [Halalkalibacter alkalisediminis]|uniref:Uncharacterized protein n=1 Tax=Halalkalibacter alkalisediminis TaxID=935616 RepID=A0ABV6NCS7_9BACI|nr:hypothetical protein [Halalkalibacter alkalisediminis]
MTLEQIFDLIANNFIFVAVVIGGLISMFGRLAGAGQQQQEQRQNRPQRAGQPQQQQETVDWREIFKQEEIEPEPTEKRASTRVETTQQASFEEGIVSRQQELQNQYEEMQRKREVSSRKNREIRKETVDLLEKKDKLDLHLNHLSNKEAMKAVVWAEVLGRPRSRQPHPTFMKKR